jgi:hypothetical protein
MSTVTGSVAKARIKIKDNRARKTATLKKGEMGKQAAGGLNATSALGSYVNKAANAAGKVASNVVPGALKGDKYDKVMEVQFNPTTLQLSSMGGADDVQVTNYTQDGAGVSRGPVGLHTELSFKLIFDQLSNYGAFTQDMLTLSTSRAVSQTAGAIGGLISGTKPSVQMIVEAFVATMRNENTRRICFEWGEFYYEGILSRVNSAYTMFDLSGNPVRAEVQVVLYLVDDDIDKEFNEYWYDAYYKAFIEGNPAAEAMMLLAEKGKSLGL